MTATVATATLAPPQAPVPHPRSAARPLRPTNQTWDRTTCRPAAPTPAPGRAASAPPHPGPARLRVAAAEAAALHRHIPRLVAAARAVLPTAADPTERAATGELLTTRELLVDLTEVPPTACCAELVFLIEVLRRALGPRVCITLVGVTPALAAPLIGGGVGDRATVVDSRGRRWPGRPDAVRPTGTWP